MEILYATVENGLLLLKKYFINGCNIIAMSCPDNTAYNSGRNINPVPADTF